MAFASLSPDLQDSINFLWDLGRAIALATPKHEYSPLPKSFSPTGWCVLGHYRVGISCLQAYSTANVEAYGFSVFPDTFGHSSDRLLDTP